MPATRKAFSHNASRDSHSVLHASACTAATPGNSCRPRRIGSTSPPGIIAHAIPAGCNALGKSRSFHQELPVHEFAAWAEHWLGTTSHSRDPCHPHAHRVCTLSGLRFESLAATKSEEPAGHSSNQLTNSEDAVVFIPASLQARQFSHHRR